MVLSKVSSRSREREKVLGGLRIGRILTTRIGGNLGYLMWRRSFAAAMLAAFVPATVALILVIRYSDLEPRKNSPLGRYVRRYLDWRAGAWRSIGQVVMWVGAWCRVGGLIPLGFGTKSATR